MGIFVRDTRLNLSPYYLRPGFAFGGSCLPKDVRSMCSIARSRGVEAPLLHSILPSNDVHIRHTLAAGSGGAWRRGARCRNRFGPVLHDRQPGPPDVGEQTRNAILCPLPVRLPGRRQSLDPCDVS